MWTAADRYDRFMGRWSRRVAARFLDTVQVPAGASWLDVGCGTGCLTSVIVQQRQPARVLGIDPSAQLLGAIPRGLRAAPNTRFVRGAAEDLPFADDAYDVTVSGLVLNFLADPRRSLCEAARVTRPGGTVAAYVWDYDHPDFFLSRFWTAAAVEHGSRPPGDERSRWPLCSSDGLWALADSTCLLAPHVWPIRIGTTFPDVDELWRGFLAGAGPAGSWAVGLPPRRRQRLRRHLELDLPVSRDGTVELSARALAIVATAGTPVGRLPLGGRRPPAGTGAGGGV